MISTCQPRACMYSARLNAARMVPPMFQAVQSTMMSRRSPSSAAGARTARSSTPRTSLTTKSLTRPTMGGHGTTSPSIVTARGPEEDAERRADPRDRLSAAARGRRSGQAAARRRPADRGARVRDLHAPLGLDAAARAARQPLADPLAARAAPALRLRALRPEVVGALDEGAGARHPRRRLPAVGPPAAPRAHSQPQVDHRRQDAQQRL